MLCPKRGNKITEALRNLTELLATLAVVEKVEIEENEFNLNLPRYVDTFEPEKVVPLAGTVSNLRQAEQAGLDAKVKLDEFLRSLAI